MRALSYIGTEKITFPPKPDIHTDRQTDGYQRLQISFANKKKYENGNMEKQVTYVWSFGITLPDRIGQVKLRHFVASIQRTFLCIV